MLRGTVQILGNFAKATMRGPAGTRALIEAALRGSYTVKRQHDTSLRRREHRSLVARRSQARTESLDLAIPARSLSRIAGRSIKIQLAAANGTDAASPKTMKASSPKW